MTATSALTQSFGQVRTDLADAIETATASGRTRSSTA